MIPRLVADPPGLALFNGVRWTWEIPYPWFEPDAIFGGPRWMTRFRSESFLSSLWRIPGGPGSVDISRALRMLQDAAASADVDRIRRS